MNKDKIIYLRQWLSKQPNYFIKDMVVTCSRCGYKENLVHKLIKYRYW